MSAIRHALFMLAILVSLAARAGDTYPPIFYAAYNNDAGITRAYVESGSSIEVIDDQGMQAKQAPKNRVLLAVAVSTLNRILKKQSGISPEIALRLSKVF